MNKLQVQDRPNTNRSLARKTGGTTGDKDSTYQYLGLTIKDEIRYGLVIRIGDIAHAAIVDKSGFIGGNWPFGMNCSLSGHAER